MYQLQVEATLGEFIFSFILYNFTFLLGFIAFKSKHKMRIPWILSLIFFLFAFWDTDYYSYKNFFSHPDENFRDPLYYYLTFMCFNSYIIFRLIIWGGALLLFHKTIKRYALSENYTVFIFIGLFLLSFSTGRVCLSMSSYFYGLSFLLIKGDNNRIKNILNASIFIILSYLAHRSILPLIIAIPLINIGFTKKKYFLMFCFLPVLVLMIKFGLNYIVSVNDTGEGNLQELSASVYSYATIDDFKYNWKFTLIRIIRECSFYCSTLFVSYIIFKEKNRFKISSSIVQLLLILVLINFVAIAFRIADVGIASKMSERYLYMSGIPICIILSYLHKYKFITKYSLYKLLFLCLLWGEAFFIGKIYSHYI